MTTRALVDEASEFLRGRVLHTPLEPSPGLSTLLGVEAWLKLEHRQVTGSFKVRGALFRLSRLTEAERGRGVVTASAGNHGKGVAHAARELGLRAQVYVPATVDAAKLQGMRDLGADVVVSACAGYDDTEVEARAAAAKSGRVFVSAFDDDAVMAGNGGSLALEVLADLPEVRTWVFPVGGGGLGAGIAIASEASGGALVACQLAASPALRLSLDRGEAVTRLPPVPTLAGGVEGGLGRRTFAVLRDRVDRVALVDEAAVAEGVRWLHAEHGELVEPTAAVVLGAALRGGLDDLAGPVVVVLTGRNVAQDTVRTILEDRSYRVG